MDSIVEAVLENSESKPDKIAIATAQREITYKELREKILSFAASLKLRGIKKGSRIAIEAVDLPSFFAACLGCHLAGMISVPIEKNISIYKLQDIFKATKPSLVFFKNTGEKFSDFFATPCDSKIRFPKGDKVSSVVSTTGTTGNPVLVEHTNKSTLATIENLVYGINITKDTVMFSNVPFDLAAGYRRVLATLYVGATAVITYKPLSEELLLKFFKDYGINSISILNIDLNFLIGIKNEELKNYISSIRFIETVAGSISSFDIRNFKMAFPAVTLYNVYGTTESGCLLINNTLENSDDGCLGYPACNVTLKIIDENGEEVTTPEKYGYICVKGNMNMAGYYRKKTLTDKVKKDDYIIINDIVYFDKQGCYYFVGRVGDIIDISGHKVVPYEIEKVVDLYSGIDSCAVAAEEDSDLGMIPVLYIECKGKGFDFEKLNDYLKKNLEEYKVPKKIIRIDKIPRTATGKIMRKLLPTAKKIN